MNLIAEISKGGVTPDGKALGRPRRIIYQCSEDGACDTIKPRLESCGADCRNVAYINEEIHDGLTLDDERIREAIIEFKPQLVVIDPLQSYIGNDSDLQIAVRARKLMKRIALWASTYDCAIVLIGHLSKTGHSKELYRGLGSIDVVASARSVLQVERDKTMDLVRFVYQSCCWKQKITYRVVGVGFREDGAVQFDLTTAYEIHEGRVRKANTKIGLYNGSNL